METVKLKFKGKEEYKGFDNDQAIIVKPNTIIDVSKNKAQQLLIDFPDNWEKAEDTELNKSERKNPTVKK
ncbi:TPA: hypothetical protein DCX16_02035 [bacterium]|nr:hypothetical protein [bacterium]